MSRPASDSRSPDQGWSGSVGQWMGRICGPSAMNLQTVYFQFLFFFKSIFILVIEATLRPSPDLLPSIFEQSLRSSSTSLSRPASDLRSPDQGWSGSVGQWMGRICGPSAMNLQHVALRQHWNFFTALTGDFRAVAEVEGCDLVESSQTRQVT